jgi:hypothetical protein
MSGFGEAVPAAPITESKLIPRKSWESERTQVRPARRSAGSSVRTSCDAAPKPPAPNPRECEILYMLSEGEAIADVAEKFHCRPGALMTRLYRMRLRHECESNLVMVALALRRGWIE